MNPNDTKLSKYMSMVLRHHPERAGIKLDKNGWADVQELIAGINKSGKGRAIRGYCLRDYGIACTGL